MALHGRSEQARNLWLLEMCPGLEPWNGSMFKELGDKRIPLPPVRLALTEDGFSLQELESVTTGYLYSKQSPNYTRVFAHPWTSDAQRSDDYRYLEELYPLVLEHLTTVLNDIHELRFAPRVWEIALGGWLGSALSIVLDRLRILEAALRVSGGRDVLVRGGNLRAPLTTQVFVETAAVDDRWNEGVLASIASVSSSSGLRGSQVPGGNLQKGPVISEYLNPRRFARGALGALRFVGTLGVRNGSDGIKNASLVWQGTYFSRAVRARIARRLTRNLRVWSFRHLPFLNIRESSQMRERLRMGPIETAADEDQFLQIFKGLLPEMLPVSLLEGFNKLLQRLERMNRFPSAIFTANSHVYDDQFKIWSASAVHSGSRLIVSEHGGFFQAPELDFGFQKRVPDIYVSPWTSGTADSVELPLPTFIRSKEPKRADQANRLLVIPYEIHRWATRASAQPQGYRGLTLLRETCRLVESLENVPMKNVTMKRQSTARYWPQPWLRLTPLIEKGMRVSSESLRFEVGQSRLVVCTYPETNYFEALLSGKPVVLLLIPSVSGIGTEPKRVLEQMLREGMAFEDASEAAAFIDKKWDSLDDWWSSPGVAGVLKTLRLFIEFPGSQSEADWAFFLENASLGRVPGLVPRKSE